MIYWYTGQPGHGKTLHGIDHAITLRDEGRLVYVCNVTGFDHAKAGMLPMTPDEFRDWMNFLPDGAVCLVDEAYEHKMLPKRPPGAAVPSHVEQLAKHRHRGLDFIFISQSPQTQCDSFVHDLIEQHIHVRRMWGLPFVWLRKFFYMERNPLKATPNVIARVRLPKRPMGLYTSTSMDTTQKHIPWYVIALGLGIPLVLFGAWYMVRDVDDALQGQGPAKPASVAAQGAGANGALATVATAPKQPTSRELRERDFAKWLEARIPGQPWTAPAYDSLSVGSRAPRVFCYVSGKLASPEATCKCLTEQGTRYAMDQDVCTRIAIDGQYEPFRDEERGNGRGMDDIAQFRRLGDAELASESVPASDAATVPPGEPMASYGGFRQ